MALTVTTPAANRKLVTLQAVKDELDIIDSEHDDLLNQYIDEASAAIETYCRRVFARQTYTETIAGYGDNYIATTARPIVSVSQVLSSNSPVIDYVIADKDKGELYRSIGWAWSVGYGFNLSRFAVPGSEEAIFAITYVAGYVLPGDVGANLPRDIQRAARLTVKSYYLAKDRDPEVTSQRVADLAITIAKSSEDSGIPASVVGLLTDYRKQF